MPAAAPLLAPSLAPDRLARGALGGLAGGIVFGAMMAMGGMLGMVAMLVGGGGDAVAWPVHLAISAAFGAAFGALVPAVPASRGLLLGVAWGVVLWAGAAVVVMRTLMGMPVAVDGMAMLSLYGHVAFGAVLGVAYALLAARSAATAPASAPVHPQP